MRYFRSIAAGVAAMLIGVASANAGSLLYSFEAGDSPNALDGFSNNGGGITVSSSTIGATVGTGSMLNTSVSGATFTGALSANVPAALNDPAVTGISFDLTIAPGQQFTGAFADVGITIFGAIGSGASETFGNQFQVDPSSEQNVGLAPGTYHMIVPLIGTDPNSFALSQPFSEVLGDGPFTPTGVEFFYSKSNDSALSVYIDNVQTVVPEPASIGIGAISGLMLLARRRRKA